MPEGESRALGSRYLLRQPVGRGAMGEVWQAWDRQTDQLVAAKLLHRHFANNVDVVSRFVQERSLLLALRHPNIIELLDMVVEGHDLAIVMTFVAGGSLGDYHKSVLTLPPAEAVSVVSGVLAALAFAHEQGVVHRDIKPDNVLLAGPEPPCEASVRLTDFGIARLAQAEVVRATGLLGTPAYMAPEMFDSGVFSQASDIYSVGIVLYELLAGRTPFEGGNSPMAVGMRHVYSLAPTLPVDDRLWQIVQRMLAKDPAYRLTAEDTLASLRQLPADALAGPALVPQAQPDTWQDVPRPAALKTPWQVHQLDGDVGHTLTPGAPSAPLPSPAPGPVRALIGTTTDNPSGLTMMAAEPHLSPAPTLVAAAPLVESAPIWRRRWFIPGLAAAVLVVAAVVFLVVRGLILSPTVHVIDYQPGHLVGTQLASGLRIDYAADQGTQPDTVAVTVGLTAAPASGLAGGLLLVLPGEADSCPQLLSTDWDQPLTAVSPSQDGLAVACAYKTTVDLAAGQTSNLRLVVSGVTTADLGGWVGQIQQATAQALTSVTGGDFALQRLAGIRLQVEDVRLQANTPAVPYVVYPVWTNQSGTAAPDPLFSNQTLPYQATDLLMSLTGNAGFDAVAVTVSQCNAAQVVGYRVIAEQPTVEPCQLQVRVGAVDPAQADFSVHMTPS